MGFGESSWVGLKSLTPADARASLKIIPQPMAQAYELKLPKSLLTCQTSKAGSALMTTFRNA